MNYPKNLMKASWLVLPLAVVVSGCAGMSAARYGQYDAPQVPVRIIPITKEIIAQERAVVPRKVGLDEAALVKGLSDYRYTIKPADILLISVPSIVSFNTAGAPSLLGPQQAEGYIVYDDGSIFLPFSGWITVGGLSIREAQERIVAALSKFLRNPQVLVTVKEFRSQRVMVAGQVQKPGYQPITDVALTLIGALTTAGAVPELRGRSDPRQVGGQGNNNQAAESPDLKRVLLKRGGVDYVINVAKMLTLGNVGEDIALIDGDTVVVAPVQRANVFVMGEVVRPSLLEVEAQDVNLAQVLMASGGMNSLTAKASSVYVIRGDYAKPEIYQIDARAPDSMLLAQQFPVKPQDVVYVAETNVSRWNKVLQQVLPTVQGLLSTAVIANTVDDLKN